MKEASDLTIAVIAFIVEQNKKNGDEGAHSFSEDRSNMCKRAKRVKPRFYEKK